MNNLCKIPFLHKYINFIDVSKKPCCIFQGQESPIVIASYATSSPEEIGLSRGSDFFFDFRRLNVSLSRARSLAIILFNKKLLNYNCSNIEDIERLNYFCKLKKYDYNPEMFLETLD